jgi:hypothetical protein
LSSHVRFSQSARFTDVIAEDVSDLFFITPFQVQQFNAKQKLNRYHELVKTNNKLKFKENNVGLSNPAMAFLYLLMSADNSPEM